MLYEIFHTQKQCKLPMRVLAAELFPSHYQTPTKSFSNPSAFCTPADGVPLGIGYQC